MTQTPAPGSLFTLTPYIMKSGTQAMMVETSVQQMAQFYAPFEGYDHFFDRSFASASGNKYIDRRIHSIDDAKQAVADFQLEPNMRKNAIRASRHLHNVFLNVPRAKTIRNLPAGKLDHRKYGRVIRDVKAGTYHPGNTRPFMQKQMPPIQKPTIAIVASGSWGEMWDDAEYIPRVAALMLGILWATEAAGFNCYAAFTLGNMNIRQDPYKFGTLFFNVNQPGKKTSLRSYAALLHRDMYRLATMAALAADKPSYERIVALSYRRPTADNLGRPWSSGNGGYAVHWMREQYGADIVISIGSVLDRRSADVELKTLFTTDYACQQIAQQLGGLSR